MTRRQHPEVTKYLQDRRLHDWKVPLIPIKGVRWGSEKEYPQKYKWARGAWYVKKCQFFDILVSLRFWKMALLMQLPRTFSVVLEQRLNVHQQPGMYWIPENQFVNHHQALISRNWPPHLIVLTWILCYKDIDDQSPNQCKSNVCFLLKSVIGRFQHLRFQFHRLCS